MTHPPVSRRTIGSWEILEVIGSGSFAIVWKARHVGTGALAAVKEILSDRLNKKLQESLESEIAVLQRLKHANIVGLLDLYKEPGKIFLVLEYCGGGDLARHLRQRGPLSEASCRYLLRHLAEGLKVLRQHNVIHRDLKPQNLLLSDNGPSPTLKIADFGFARSLQPAGLAETLCGSPLYMAPEVLQLHRYDAKADLWSVGTILFELLTGKPPFDGANHFQLVQNIERGDAALPDNIARALSPGCRQLLHQLLRRNPVERISFDQLFAHPFLAGEAASAAVVYPLAAASGAAPSSGAAAAAPLPVPQHAPRRCPPASQGAVRFVQPIRCSSPVHPAFQVPTPSPLTPPSVRHPQQEQQLHQTGSQAPQAKTVSGCEPAAPLQAGQPTTAGALGGFPSMSLRTAGGDTPAAVQTVLVPPPPPPLGSEGGHAGGAAVPAPQAINVRELTRSPSPRIMAAAAMVASAFLESGTGATAAAAATAGAAAAVASRELLAPQALPAGCPGNPHRGGGGGSTPTTTTGGTLGVVSTSGLLGGGRGSGSSGPLVDSVDSDYVVISSPSATPSRAPVPLSPRVPHPAMTGSGSSSKGSRGGSAGGAPQAAAAAITPPAPLPHPEGPAVPSGPSAAGDGGQPTGAASAEGATAGAAAAAAATAAPSWQQLLSPIAAATLPPSQPRPYTPPLGPGRPPHLAAAASSAGPAAAAPVASAAVTFRLPSPSDGGCCPGALGAGPMPGGSEAGVEDPLLLPRVVGVLLDHARARCSTLLDQEAESRQLGGAAGGGGGLLAGGPGLPGFSAMGGFGAAIGCAGAAGAEAAARASMSEEAAAAVGTLLMACRLLVAALAGAGGEVSEALQGRSTTGEAVDASSLKTETAAATATAAATSPASAQTLAALAGHARSILATLDEHLYGTVAQLLLEGPGRGPQPPLAAPSVAAAGAGAPTLFPGPPGTAPRVPCALDTLLAVAVHHSRAAAGEELLGNCARAAEQYGKAADVLLFLLGAPAPGSQQTQQTTQQQQESAVGQVGGPTVGSGELLLDGARHALTPHDRQRLTKYYAAARLRQSAARAAAGPSAALVAPEVPPYPSHQHPFPHHPNLAPLTQHPLAQGHAEQQQPQQPGVRHQQYQYHPHSHPRDGPGRQMAPAGMGLQSFALSPAVAPAAVAAGSTYGYSQGRGYSAVVV